MPELNHNLRIRFSKQGDVRYVAHRDTMRLFERALRRAQLPVALSQGFNPHARISLPMPLSVGIAGLNEVLDVRFSEWIRPEEAVGRLQEQLPEGIGLESAEITAPNPNRQPSELSYRVPLLPGHTVSKAQIAALLERARIPVTRMRKDKPKEVEIRQFVKVLRLLENAVHMLLGYNEHGTARPEEVMEALGCREGADYLLAQIVRTNVSLNT